MPKVLYIVLGSNFEKYQEYEIGVIKDFVRLGYEVDIYSIDRIKLPKDVQPEEKMDNALIRRKVISLSNSTIDDFSKSVYSQETHYDYAIILDGIDFKSKSEISETLKSTFEKMYPELRKAPIVFHYITPKFGVPSMSLIEDLEFSLISILDEPETQNEAALLEYAELLSLLKNEEKFRQLLKSYDKSDCKLSMNNKLQLFAANFLLKTSLPTLGNHFLNPERAAVLLGNIITRICSAKINLSAIGLTPPIAEAKRLEPSAASTSITAAIKVSGGSPTVKSVPDQPAAPSGVSSKIKPASHGTTKR